jgi:hypothetical protein
VPELNAVYRKFGEVAEAAQLLETELGNLLLLNRAAEQDLIANPNLEVASAILDAINRHTLGQLIRGLNAATQTLNALEPILVDALRERNRLFHSFYRNHNFRRNSDEGRQLMLKDLELIHGTVLRAYKAVMLLSGVDLDALVASDLESDAPARHLSI